MTILTYQDQSAEDLRLNLVQGAVDKKQLTVLCTGNIEVPYGRVEAGIIGASHYLEFTLPNGHIVFTEVFACTEIESTEKIFYGGLQDAGSIKKHFKDMTYTFRVRNMKWGAGEAEFEHLMEVVKSAFNQFQFGLQFSFPKTDDLEFPPVTLMYVQADPENMAVEVKTLHAYPSDKALVFTETKLQPR